MIFFLMLIWKLYEQIGTYSEALTASERMMNHSYFTDSEDSVSYLREITNTSSYLQKSLFVLNSLDIQSSAYILEALACEMCNF